MKLPLQSKILARSFGLLTGATFALLVVGALVRAKGAGLACPDWPLCFGALVPSFDVRVGFEWGHRVFAAAIALGLAVLTLCLRQSGQLTRVAKPLALAWVLLGVQILLGGLTVLLLLEPWTVTAHLLIGTGFCGTLLWIARALYETGAERRASALSTALVANIAAVCALLLGQIALGGMVSSHGAGLACASFPSCDGASLAPTLSGLVGLHVLHRLNAYALTLGFIALAWLARGRGTLSRLSWVGAHLVVLQVGLGALNVLLRLPVEVTALHSATAAALALTTILIAREAWLAVEPAPASVRRAAEAQ